MGEALGPFPIFDQRVEAHDPRPGTSIHRAFIANHEQIFAESVLLDAGEAAQDFRRLHGDEAQFHERRLPAQPLAALPAKSALAIVEDEERFHRGTAL